MRAGAAEAHLRGSGGGASDDFARHGGAEARNKGGQVFIDISGEERPPDGADEPEEEEPSDESRKRARRETVEELGAGELASMEGVMPASIDELMGEEKAETEANGSASARDTSSRRESASTTMEPEVTPPPTVTGTTAEEVPAYGDGPARRDRTSTNHRFEELGQPNQLTRALNRSVDMLDMDASGQPGQQNWHVRFQSYRMMTMIWRC